MASLRKCTVLLLYAIFLVAFNPVKSANYFKFKSFECKTGEIAKDFVYSNYSCSLISSRKDSKLSLYVVLKKELPNLYVSSS